MPQFISTETEYQFPPRFLRFFGIGFLVCLGIIFLNGCLGTSSDEVSGEEKYSVKLNGRVLNSAGKPLAGVVAKLAQRGLADTTDEDGRYEIREALDVSSAKLTAEDVLDTLTFYFGGKSATTLLVRNWIDTLPNVYIVQRGVAGKVILDGEDVAEVWAVVSHKTETDTSYRRLNLWLNPMDSSYSGFIYFSNSEERRHYEIFVELVDGKGVLLGRSDTLPFDSRAGDLNLRTFMAGNAKPAITLLGDSLANSGSEILLKPNGSDAFGGDIVKWWWDIGATGQYISASGKDTTVTVPDAPTDSFISVLRAEDDEGNISETAHRIRVINNEPKAVLNAPESARVDSNFQVQWKDSHHGQLGTLKTFELSVGKNAPFFKVAGEDTILKAPSILTSNYPIILRVTDNFGNIGLDTSLITIEQKWDSLVSISELSGNMNYKSSSIFLISSQDWEFYIKNNENDLFKIYRYKDNDWQTISGSFPQTKENYFKTNLNFSGFQSFQLHKWNGEEETIPRPAIHDSSRLITLPNTLSCGDTTVIPDQLTYHFYKWVNDSWIGPDTLYITGDRYCLWDEPTFSQTPDGFPVLFYNGPAFFIAKVFRDNQWRDLSQTDLIPDNVKVVISYQLSPQGIPYVQYLDEAGCKWIARKLADKWDILTPPRENCLSNGFTKDVNYTEAPEFIRYYIGFTPSDAPIIDFHFEGGNKRYYTWENNNNSRLIYENDGTYDGLSVIDIGADSSIILSVFRYPKPGEFALVKIKGEEHTLLGNKWFSDRVRFYHASSAWHVIIGEYKDAVIYRLR